MIVRPLALLCVAIAAVFAAAPWTVLFDGKSSTTGAWREVTGKPFPENSWRIEDGSLRAIPAKGGLQDICTVEEFTSFELAFDWKLAQDGNSGVKFLVQKRDEWTNQDGRQARARGLEFQLAGPAEPGALTDPKRTAGALYSVLAPTAAPGPAPADGFHLSRLIVRGNQVEHWLDGARVLAYDLQSAEVQKALQQLAGAGRPITSGGPICLQNHGSLTSFRNILVRRLE